MVLAYHLLPSNVHIFKGGFIGVDIFFVLSGYLTTALIVEKLPEFDLFGFFAKRIRRLVPLLLFMVGTSSVALLGLPGDFRSGLLKQVMAAIAQCTNYYEIATGGSYGSSFFAHIFIHTWTLGVEFQYYILWAIIIAFIALFVRTSDAARRIIAPLALVLAIGSAVLMVTGSTAIADTHNFTDVYFALQTHGFTVMMGSAIGAFLGTKPKQIEAGAVGAILPITAGLGLVGLAQVLRFDELSTYHYGLILTSVLTSVIIVTVLKFGQGTKTSEWFIIEYFSSRSYAIYLFHWPISVLLKDYAQVNNYSNQWILMLATLLLTLIFAEIGYLAFGSVHEWKPAQVMTSGVVVVMLASSLFVALTSPLVSATELDLNAKTRTSAISNLAPYCKDMGTFVSKSPVVDHDHPELLPNPEKFSNYSHMADQARLLVGDESHVDKTTMTIIGDSVTNITSNRLRSTIPGLIVDAMGNRKMDEGLAVVEDLKSHDALPHTIVISLGTNIISQDVSKDAALKIIDEVGPGHNIIFVTGYGIGYGGMAKFADWLRTLPDQYSNVTIADWAAAIAPIAEKDRSAMTNDAFHPGRPDTEQLYADVVKAAIEKVKDK
jgi:peptidoglycan/LPS O-acetylase OafA/YrhL